jgi:hypothetical protein
VDDNLQPRLARSVGFIVYVPVPVDSVAADLVCVRNRALNLHLQADKLSVLGDDVLSSLVC